MQQFRTEAIILRRTNYGEADRILNLLTPQQGKVSAIAKGVRRPKSKLAGGLELFAICDVTILQGKSDMGVVTSARIKDFFGDILRDYDRMQLAYEAIKQVNRVTETITDSEFYALLRDTLVYLGDLRIDWRLTEIWFWLQLASALGGGLDLKTDKNGEPLKEEQRYRFDDASKAFYKYESGEFDGQHIKLLRLASYKTPSVLNKVGGVKTLNWAALLALAKETGSQ